MKITQRWIAELAGGRSFVDVGGLWGTTNERVSDALKAGAASAAMADIAPPDHRLWAAFDERMAGMGLTDYERISADVMAPDLPERVAARDLVHCSGVIYHMPDPMGCLRNLRAITKEHLILVSMVVPEIISNSAGTLDFRGAGTFFLPALDEHQHRVLHEYFEKAQIRVHGITGAPIPEWTDPVDGAPRFGPWWWLLTPHLVRTMVSISGFELVEDAPVVEGRSHGFLCRRV